MRCKIITILFIFLIFINLVYAVNLGLSKAKMEFFVELNEEKCQDLTLFSGQKVLVKGEDKWTIINSKDITKYNNKAQDFEITINYPASVEFNKKENIQVCVKTGENGKYYGVLIYKEQDIIGVGSWIEITSGNGVNPNYQTEKYDKDENTTQSSSVVLTGRTIENNQDFKINNTQLILVFSLILLIIVIAILFFLNKNKKRKGVI